MVPNLLFPGLSLASNWFHRYYKQKFPWGESTFFRRKIEEKVKKHTIRMDVHNRWHAGIKIQHAYGVRTKKYEQFGEGICISTQSLTAR